MQEPCSHSPDASQLLEYEKRRISQKEPPGRVILRSLHSISYGILYTHSQALKIRTMASRPTSRMLLRKLRQSIPVPTQPKLTITCQLRLVGRIQRDIIRAALDLLPKRIVAVVDMNGLLVHGLACHQVLDHFPQVYLAPR